MEGITSKDYPAYRRSQLQDKTMKRVTERFRVSGCLAYHTRGLGIVSAVVNRYWSQVGTSGGWGGLASAPSAARLKSINIISALS